MSECIFCRIISKEIPSEMVFESENFIVIRDVNPKVLGHMLVMPKKHVRSFVELDKGLYEEFLETVKRVVEQEGVENFNLALNEGRVAGRIIDHLHLHILPRKEGDGFDLGV